MKKPHGYLAIILLLTSSIATARTLTITIPDTDTFTSCYATEAANTAQRIIWGKNAFGEKSIYVQEHIMTQDVNERYNIQKIYYYTKEAIIENGVCPRF